MAPGDAYLGRIFKHVVVLDEDVAAVGQYQPFLQVPGDGVAQELSVT